MRRTIIEKLRFNSKCNTDNFYTKAKLIAKERVNISRTKEWCDRFKYWNGLVM